MKPQPIAVPNRPRGLKFQIDALADPRFQIDAAAAMVDLFDAITPATPTRLAAALRQIGNRPITLRLNSLGGDPFSGLAAFNLLTGHPADVRVEILGIAASAASIVAMSGDEIAIAAGAQVMVHNAQAGVIGGAEDLRQLADGLDRVDSAMAAIYQARSGLPLQQVRDLMAREAFLDAEESVRLGFADRVLEQDALPAPRVASASAAPQSKREFEAELRRLGFSRTVAARMTAAAWPAVSHAGDEPDVDLDLIATAFNTNIAALGPRRSH